MRPWLAEVTSAASGLEQARETLQRAVDLAREEGASWAEIGACLGVSRQAAFKRFGHPRDPRDGAAMPARDLAGVEALTEQVVRDLDAGAYDAIRALMTDDVAAELTRDRVLGAWARVVGDIGNLEGLTDTHVELADRTRLAADDAVRGLVVGDTVARCEAGETRVRVALDEQDRVVGLLVVPVDATDLAF